MVLGFLIVTVFSKRSKDGELVCCSVCRVTSKAP
jgi:hypothetical protein